MFKPYSVSLTPTQRILRRQTPMQRCTDVRLGCARRQCLFSVLLQGQCYQQRRSITYDSSSVRQRYLLQINNGLDDPSLVIDPVEKTISTAAGPLPLSPLMDPDWIEATRRWRYDAKAPEGTTAVGRFRKKLKKCPYGTVSMSCVATFHASRFG